MEELHILQKLKFHSYMGKTKTLFDFWKSRLRTNLKQTNSKTCPTTKRTIT